MTTEKRLERLTLQHYGGKGHYMKCSEQFGCDGLCGNCDELDKLVERLAFYEDRAEQTVDAVEVKHGRWEPHPRHPGFDRCSACCNCNIGNDWADGEKWNYCPNCGAKMDGDGNA